VAIQETGRDALTPCRPDSRQSRPARPRPGRRPRLRKRVRGPRPAASVNLAGARQAILLRGLQALLPIARC